MTADTDTATPPLAEWIADLSRRGFLPGGPSADAERLDREAVAEARCDECGHAGLDAYPRTLPARPGHGARYLVVVACPECGRTEEW